MNRRKGLMFLGVIGVSIVLICVLPLTFISFYNSSGRIMDFQPVADGVQIAGTDYILRVISLPTEESIASIVEYDVSLNNTSNHNHYPVFRIDYWNNADFAVLNDLEKTYLITRRHGLHNDAAGWYEIFDITGSSPVNISMLYGNRAEPYDSCVNPRLENHSLHFELAYDCDAYPLFAKYPNFYSVKLR